MQALAPTVSLIIIMYSRWHNDVEGAAVVANTSLRMLMPAFNLLAASNRLLICRWGLPPRASGTYLDITWEMCTPTQSPTSNRIDLPVTHASLWSYAWSSHKAEEPGLLSFLSAVLTVAYHNQRLILSIYHWSVTMMPMCSAWKTKLLLKEFNPGGQNVNYSIGYIHVRTKTDLVQWENRKFVGVCHLKNILASAWFSWTPRWTLTALGIFGLVKLSYPLFSL